MALLTLWLDLFWLLNKSEKVLAACLSSIDNFPFFYHAKVPERSTDFKKISRARITSVIRVIVIKR